MNAAVQEQRGIVESEELAKRRSQIRNAGTWLFIGWVLHYLPFWTMTRVLYFHHYFPALLFSSMLSGITLNYMIESATTLIGGKVGNTVYHVTVGFVMSTMIYRYNNENCEMKTNQTYF